jgi:hypothetical protein
MPDVPKARPGIEPATDQVKTEWEELSALCLVKAEAARWAAECQRCLRERVEPPHEEAPGDPAMRAWAEALTDAFYWASAADPSAVSDIALLDDVGGCFETVSEGLLLARDAELRPRGLERALPLLAEAQSALRLSLQRLEAPDDPDQLAAYEMVRDTAARHRVFLKRFLRADDLANPEAWPDRLARIENQRGSRPPSQRQAMLLDRLRSLCAQDVGERTDESWREVIAAVDDVVAEGTPPSSRELRELLLPLLEDLPEVHDMRPGAARVLREIDRFVATRSPRSTGATAQVQTAEMREAARLLSGRSIVLIGGIRRPETQEALRSAFGLEELVWIGTRVHQSIRGFEVAIARPEVAAVLLAIRWSSHSFGDVKEFCDRYGKPLVRLPGGYNPAQVAAQILAQCSGQLER